jgi:hypothetical protein
MKRKFNQWWSSIPPISKKRTITSHLNCLIFFLFLFLRSNIKHICLNSEQKSDTKWFQFYPATCLCLSQAMDVNVICRGHFMLNGVRWEVNVRLVDIGEIVDHHFLYLLFLLAIVLSVVLRYTDSDYPFGIFKLFFHNYDTFVTSKLLQRLDTLSDIYLPKCSLAGYPQDNFLSTFVVLFLSVFSSQVYHVLNSKEINETDEWAIRIEHEFIRTVNFILGF